MFALRTSFLVLGLTLGVFASVMNLEYPSGKEYDLVCSNAAKENNIANPENWLWSAADATCVTKDGDSTAMQLVTRDDPDTAADDDNVELEARIGCYEGSLSKCLQDCGDFKPGHYQSGESGAWAGCRASCNFRCGTIKGGCYRNYCWASCHTGFPLLERQEWCYTTKSYSQSYRYEKCTRNDECNLTWKCAGPCAAF